MGKHKGYCSKCNKRYFPPTGKKCQEIVHEQSAAEEMPVKPRKKKSVIDGRDSQLGKSKVLSPMSLHGQSSVTRKQDFHVKRASTPGLEDQSDSEDDLEPADGGSTSLQLKILEEIKKVSSRLDVVEHQVAEGGQRRRQREKKDYKLSTEFQSKSDTVKCKNRHESSDSESDDACEIPILSTLRSSKAIQKHVDRAVADLERSQAMKGKDQVIKSKRGGPVDVIVAKKVSWPQEYILGGTTKQRITFDQLNLTQFVNGFVRGVLDEKSQNVREKMLSYLCDLMEDANDFSWASAKASHAVLLCEMERGTLEWSNTDRIDRIRRAHAQRHSISSKQNWVRNQDFQRKPWFCKSYQTGTCTHNADHDLNGKTQRHICAYCLTQGRNMTHPEKDCYFAKKQKQSKNEQQAAQ